MFQLAMSMNDRATSSHPLLEAAAGLSDDRLLARVEDLARGSRRITVELLAHLGELQRRKLHRGQGFGRLFVYCTEVLKFSEYSAYHRLQAARAARRFPVVLDLLASGRVNLTTVRLLAPYLTEENHRSLLTEASGRPRRFVDKIVARLNPQPDVRSSIRKLPTRRTEMTSEAAGGPGDGTRASQEGAASGARDDQAAATPAPAPAPPAAPAGDSAAGMKEGPAPSAAAGCAAPRRGILAPLRPGRYKLEVTLGEEEHDDLRWLQDAMRREIPDGDPAAIVRAALKAWRAAIEKKRFCATKRPQPAKRPTAGSRDVSSGVQRQVWQRDDGRCAFVARNGKRCSERSYLEYHHEDPYAIGGEPTIDNISLRCRAHNVYEAELAFGAAAVARSREEAVARRQRVKSASAVPPSPAPAVQPSPASR